MSNDYMDLGQRLENDFPEIENDIMADLQESSEEYDGLHRQLSELKAQHPAVRKLMEGDGEVCLTAEEHAALKQIVQLRFRLDDLERRQSLLPGPHGRDLLSEKSGHPVTKGRRWRKPAPPNSYGRCGG